MSVPNPLQWRRRGDQIIETLLGPDVDPTVAHEFQVFMDDIEDAFNRIQALPSLLKEGQQLYCEVDETLDTLRFTATYVDGTVKTYSAPLT